MTKIRFIRPQLGMVRSQLSMPAEAKTARDMDRHRDRSDPCRALYKTARWQRLRLAIFLRDLYTCQRTACARIESDTSQLVTELAGGGSNPAGKALAALGISATDAAGQVKGVDEVMIAVADKFAAVQDGRAKTAIAMQLFGKSGAQLIPTLNLRAYEKCRRGAAQ